ncbi:MAG TPA: hypothetical protein EYP85_15590 [Armatimonadetes bacterium]|nr:hypothetical protein [Armatimonadota bacterium]
MDCIVLYHQHNPRYYRSRDYFLEYWEGEQWRELVRVEGNQTGGWIAHTFPPVTTDRLRLTITLNTGTVWAWGRWGPGTPENSHSELVQGERVWYNGLIYFLAS